MAANNDAGALALIDDLVEELRLRETPLARKSNTVTTLIGSVATFLATLAASWLESGTSVPAWLPPVVLILGMLGTTYGVSQTKNGMTSSVALKLREGLTDRIDLHHLEELRSNPLPDPVTQEIFPVDKVLALRGQADAMIDEVRDLR